MTLFPSLLLPPISLHFTAQVDALLEDRSVRVEESQTLQDRDAAKIQILSDRLLTTQNMLYDSTKDYLDLKYEFRSHERAWMAEKDALLSEMEGYRDKLDVSEGVDPILGRLCEQQDIDSKSVFN